MVNVARSRIHELLSKLGSLIETGLPIELVDSVDALCLHSLSQGNDAMITLTDEHSKTLSSRLELLMDKGAQGDTKTIIQGIITDLKD